jgi:DNA modification methylase
MSVVATDEPVRILVGDCVEQMRTLPDGCVQTCITSPPYYGLRDYGHAGQIGLEDSPDAYVQKMVEVFREVRRVLRDDGTLWLNLGDSYAGSLGNYGGQNRGNGTQRSIDKGSSAPNPAYDGLEQWRPPASRSLDGIKPKDLLGIPWRVAFALQADGWYLRQDLVWHKPNPMPESVRDRCTKAHEYVFLMAKRERYYYDAEAIKELATPQTRTGRAGYLTPKQAAVPNLHRKSARSTLNAASGDTRNRRSVWTITLKPFKGAHFAVMPPELVRPCVRAGSRPGDVVLDPFGGSGTTALVALEEGRRAILCELNPQYAEMARGRVAKSLGLFAEVAT